MSTDSTKEAMPFNDHTPLPWAAVHEVPPLGGREYWVGIHLTDRVSQIDAFTSHDKDTSTFILHACNTYYEREQARQQDKARIEELAGALRKAQKSLDELRGLDPFINDAPMRQLFARNFYAGVNVIDAILTPSTQ